MECISTKEKKEILKRLKKRVIAYVEFPDYYDDDPYDACDYCPINNDSILHCLDIKSRTKFNDIRYQLSRKKWYGHTCKLNFEALRILLGAKLLLKSKILPTSFETIVQPS